MAGSYFSLDLRVLTCEKGPMTPSEVRGDADLSSDSEAVLSESKLGLMLEDEQRDLWSLTAVGLGEQARTLRSTGIQCKAGRARH